MNSFLRKLRWPTQRPWKEAELREELQFHLAEEAEQRQGDGLAAEEARWAASRELGNLSLVEEKVSYNVARRTERSPGAHSRGDDPVECGTSGRLHACTEGVSNRPDDGYAAHE
jgi:hypothetical protein